MGRSRRRQHVAARRLRALLQHQQPPEPDRDGDQPAVHAAAGDRQPDVPEPAVRPRRRDLDSADAVRPRQPARPHLQRERAARAAVAHGADGRLRGIARPAPAAQQRRQHRAADYRTGRAAFHPRQHAAPDTAVSRPSSSRAATAIPGTTRSSSRYGAAGATASPRSRRTRFRRARTPRRQSTFFSDATNGTTAAMPEYIPDYNKGLSDFDVRHNWVLNFSYELPFANDLTGVSGALLDGWKVSGIWTDAQRAAPDGFRDVQPLALAVEPVARPWYRPGPPGLRARLRSRQRRPRPPRAVVRSRSVRRCSPPAPSVTPAAATSSARTCGRSTCR